MYIKLISSTIIMTKNSENNAFFSEKYPLLCRTQKIACAGIQYSFITRVWNAMRDSKQ